MQKIIFLSFLITLLFSCNDDSNVIDNGLDISDPISKPNVKNFTGNSSHPFFEVSYVQNTLGINLNRIVSSSKVYEVISEMTNLDNIDQVISIFEDENIYPCWSCAETDYFESIDVNLVLTPMIDMNSEQVKAILLHTIDGTETKFHYMDSNILTHVYNGFGESGHNETTGYIIHHYYYNMVEYFTLLKENMSPEVNNYLIFKSKSNCVYNSAVGEYCTCKNEADSGTLCYTDDPRDCDESQCPGASDEVIGTGGTTGGPTPSPPPTTVIGPTIRGWIVTIGPSGSAGGSSIGGNTPDVSPYPNSYDIPPPPNGNGSEWEWIFIIDQLLNHINNNTNIELTLQEYSTLTSLSNFSLLVYPLAYRLSNISEAALDVYINFITDHTNFARNVDDSVYLMENSDFTDALDNWLDSHSGELGQQLGYFILDTYFENGLSGNLRNSFTELSQAYTFINNFGSHNSPISSLFVIDPLTGEVTSQFNWVVNIVPFNWVEIKITGTPGIESNDPINVDPYVMSSDDPVRSRLQGIPFVAGLKMEQKKIIGGNVVNNPVEGFTYFEVQILYGFEYGIDFGIEAYFPWESIATCTMNNFTGEEIQVRGY